MLIGLLLGSLRKVWPWKVDIQWMTDESGQYVLSHGERIVTEQLNVWPDISTQAGVIEALTALALAALGIGAVLLIERIASRSGGSAPAVSSETGSASG